MRAHCLAELLLIGIRPSDNRTHCRSSCIIMTILTLVFSSQNKQADRAFFQIFLVEHYKNQAVRKISP